MTNDAGGTQTGAVHKNAGSWDAVVVGVLFFVGSVMLSVPVSAAGPANVVRVTEDIPYAEVPGFDTALTALDVYRPGEGTGHPVLVFTHGGAWKMGDKGHHRDLAEFFAKKGYVVVNINYRLSPEVIHPAHVTDVAEAVAWVFNTIDRYGRDAERIFIMGHSAGAHLAALVATDERYPAAHGLSPAILAGVIPLDGAGFDIPELMQQHERAYGRMYRTAFGVDPAIWADASPINHIRPGKPMPPFLVVWAGIRGAARWQTRRFAEALADAGASVRTYHAEDKTHGSVLRDIGKPGDETTEQILQFLQNP